MELSQAKISIKDGQLAAKASAAFLTLSQVSLGIAIVLAPFRYHHTILERSIPTIYGDYTNLYLYIADIPLILTLVFWLFSLVCVPRQVSLRPKLLTFSLAGLLGISILSNLFSIDPTLSLYNSVRMLALFGLYIYLINEVLNLWMILVPAGLQLFIQSVVGIAQVLRQHSLGLTTLQEFVLDPSVKGVSIVWTAATRSLRAYGLTDHPNILGGCLAFCLLLLAAGYLQSRSAWRPWLGGLFGLGALALLLTFSRAAWLALVTGILLMGTWFAVMHERDRLLTLVGLCAAAFLILTPFIWSSSSYLGSRLNLDGSFSAATPENQSINERSLLVKQANQMIARHPLTGLGLGTFPEALRQQDPKYPFDYQPPHLVPMEIAAETGLPGAIFYLLALAAPWILLFTNRQAMGVGSVKGGRRAVPSVLSSPLPGNVYLIGVTAALLAITVVSFLDYYPWLLNPGRIWQWLLWGLWGGVYIRISKRGEHD
ncbi:MAG: O-antigen ligase family protein [Omnitrophica WOR_2 bacterium]